MPDSMKLLHLSNIKNENNILKIIYSIINYFFVCLYNKKKLRAINKLYVSDFDIKYDNIPKSYYFKMPVAIDKQEALKYQSIKPIKNEIVFRGIMNFEPNVTALRNFYYEIFLELKKILPEIKLIVIGASVSDKLRRELNDVKFKGYVRDMYLEMAKSLFHIVPMVSGSGIKNKLLDAIALKRIVFSTLIGIRGIFKNEEEASKYGVIVYKNKNDFINKFMKIYYNGIDEQRLEGGFQFLFKETWSKKRREIENIVFNNNIKK
jgi:glycosyltransferase involved in cell wall biosynthesis